MRWCRRPACREYTAAFTIGSTSRPAGRLGGRWRRWRLKERLSKDVVGSDRRLLRIECQRRKRALDGLERALNPGHHKKSVLVFPFKTRYSPFQARFLQKFD